MSTVSTATLQNTAPELAKKRLRPNPARRKTARNNAALPNDGHKNSCAKNEVEPPRPALSKQSAQAKGVTKAAKPVVSLDAGASTQPPSKAITKVVNNVCNPKVEKKTQSINGKRTNARFQKPTQAAALAPSATVTGGLIGCAAGAAVVLGTGLWKSLAGPESAILAARTAKLCIDGLIEEMIASLKAGTYNAPEALDMLRRTTLAYANTIPGGPPFVERVFREVDMVRRQQGPEVDKAIASASLELSTAGRTAGPAEVQDIVLRNVLKLSRFAGNATKDVLARNPAWQPYGNGFVQVLQQPSDSKVHTLKFNMAIRHK